MRRSTLFILVFSLVFIPVCVFANPLVNEPKARVFNIEYPSQHSGSGWIDSETDFVVEFPLHISKVREVLSDFSAYPRVFPRLVRTTVLTPEGESPTIRQRYEINILGYRYPTEYDLALVVDDSAYPERWVLSWNLAGSDGSVGRSRGAWTLEAAGTAENPATRVTHRNCGTVRAAFPLQEKIMRMVAQRELSRSLMAVYSEARCREAGEKKLALAK